MPDNRALEEVLQAFPSGVNTLLDPALLKASVASRLHNVVVRGGLAESRPLLSSAACPASGRFQGAFAYELENDLRWIVVAGGSVWRYRFASADWLLLHTFPTADFGQAYFCQAGKYCIVQNGVYEPVENWPLILHGDSVVDNLGVEFIYGNSIAKVADFNPDNYDQSLAPIVPPPYGGLPDVYRVPIGKAMAYGQGRLFVAVERYWDNGISSGRDPGWRTGEGLRNVVASDEYYWDDTDRMLVFTENDLLTGGGAFSPPEENGFITAMTFFRNAATGTGLGELLVLCRRGCSAFAVSVDRAQWGAAGFGQQLFQSSGSSSPWALLPVNSDLAYVSEGGLRTIKYTTTNETASGGLASVPLSPELRAYVSRTAASQLPFVTAALADNYLFFTAGGVETPDGGVAFTDVLPWDLAAFQASGESPARVFAGAWRGPLFHAVLKTPAGVGAVYRAGAGYAIGEFSGDDPSLVSVVRTGALVFGGLRNAKRVKYADLIFDRVTTNLMVRVRWRVDGNPAWNSSDVRSFRSAASASTGLFRVPVAADNDGVGNLFEFAVEWTGHARLKLCLLSAVATDTFSGGEDGNMCASVALPAAGAAAESPEE